MQILLPKIEIYRTRTFSDKLTDTFNFIRENWRPLLKYLIYVMLPVSIIMAFFVNHFWNGYLSLIMARLQYAVVCPLYHWRRHRLAGIVCHPGRTGVLHDTPV